MPENPEDFRNQLWKPLSREERLQEAAVRFEHSTVTFLLDTLGYKREKAEMLREARDELGLANLNLLMFRRKFPEFPVFLMAKYRNDLHTLTSCSQVALFRNFRASPLAEAYTELYDQAREDPAYAEQPLAVILPRVGLARGLVVREACPFRGPGLTWHYRSTWYGKDVELFVEPFQNLVKAIRDAGAHRRS